MSAAKFRLNRYNWFGQKLLAQHRYNDIIKLRQVLEDQHRSTRVSDQMIFIHGVALMKTSTRLDEVIFALQRLNFYKNSQYLLVLCQCLLYIGNYDSVVAICKQIINKEINSLSSFEIQDPQEPRPADCDTVIALPESSAEPTTSGSRCFSPMAFESVDFQKTITTISASKLVKEPRIWFIFGVCLEHQRQFKDADLAFRVATKLAVSLDKRSHQQASDSGPTCVSNYLAPHIRYANFCIQHKDDHRTALQTLAQAAAIFPQNFKLNSLLALVTSAQSQSSQSNFLRASEILSAMEANSIASRNPSLGYNSLALRCRKRLQTRTMSMSHSIDREVGDEQRVNLDYLLARSYVILNGVVQNSESFVGIYKITQLNQTDSDPQPTRNQVATFEQVDKLIESLRNSTGSCWASFALWNNLGVCYLMKKRLIACLSCLLKAQQLNPLDWRVNYNLALANLHVGLASSSLVNLFAVKNLQRLDIRHQTLGDPTVGTLLAICFDKLNEVYEARRFYSETTRARRSNSLGMPLMTLLNYLIYLQRNAKDPEANRVKGRLLDQMEQLWLQRNQNDPQFNLQLLDVARRIGETIAESRKTYAWAKSDRSAI